jgi:hypothetical protein
MSRKKNYQCLLVRTKDRKNFFTHEKHLPELVEFSKTFGAEISVVQVKEAEVLDLVELGNAICEGTYRCPHPDYEIIETKLPLQIKKRTSVLKTSQTIRSFIRNKLLGGDVVSLQELTKKFKKYRLTSACLCNHVKYVRASLQAEGHVIEKVGGGKYRISSN